MKSFFTAIGHGILYFFTPFIWIIGISIGGALAVLLFFGYALYSIFLFFTGRNLFKSLPEDERVEEIKALEEGRNSPQEEIETVQESYSQPVQQENTYENHYKEDTYVEEEPKNPFVATNDETDVANETPIAPLEDEDFLNENFDNDETIEDENNENEGGNDDEIDY